MKRNTAIVTRTNLINSKTVFISTLMVAPTLTLIVYLTGIQEHRTLYLNSLLSTTILSFVFLTFITIGLYNGWKLTDRLGNFYERFQRLKKTDAAEGDISSFEPVVFEDAGIEGCLFSLVLWIVLAIFGSVIFWWIGTFFAATLFFLAGILYWIIFRAFRLIFKNSAQCKGKLFKSLAIAVLFTFLYNCWIYAIILGTHFLN